MLLSGISATVCLELLFSFTSMLKMFRTKADDAVASRGDECCTLRICSSVFQLELGPSFDRNAVPVRCFTKVPKGELV